MRSFGFYWAWDVALDFRWLAITWRWLIVETPQPITLSRHIGQLPAHFVQGAHLGSFASFS
ncbi:hypothetical protein [Pseudomonas viridiflava]|uniref:hypothetical protein n=1 Tax=Pseudomonas viridiflava TaxID=33069 RepID=UPI000F02B336|nr:hypothetical protein [Pseudomonas viridiflava]